MQSTIPRTNGGEPLVQLGHALRDEFIPAGTDVDAAIERAIAMSRDSRALLNSTEPASRGTAVLQASTGELYLTGLNSDPFHPSDFARGLELRDGVIGRAELWDVPRPGFESNQLTAADIYLGPLDSGFGAPQLTKLVDGLIAVAGPNGATRL
jgi:hypothetical protein